MKQFHLSLNSNEIIRETIEQARKFIYLAIFQIHSHEIFNALIRQANNGVWVVIITLPNDSVNEVTLRWLHNNLKNGESGSHCSSSQMEMW
jgi:phosphatidylserine/phosphatidylglycerophosphate/cardiolipin synthase-like enzyme